MIFYFLIHHVINTDRIQSCYQNDVFRSRNKHIVLFTRCSILAYLKMMLGTYLGILVCLSIFDETVTGAQGKKIEYERKNKERNTKKERYMFEPCKTLTINDKLFYSM